MLEYLVLQTRFQLTMHITYCTVMLRQYSTVQYNTVQYSTIQNITVQYSEVQ